MEAYIEFLTMYLVGIVIYPFYLVYWFISTPLWLSVWLVVSAVVLVVLHKLGSLSWRKPFIAIWILPGTIICGAATVVPWPLAVSSFASGTGCTTSWALFSALVFNFIITYAVAYLWQTVKIKWAAKNA